jgi:hypothetical protein
MRPAPPTHGDRKRIGLRDLPPGRWCKSHPENILEFRRTESAARRMRHGCRERRRQRAKAKQ